MKKFIVFFCLVITFESYSQELKYKSQITVVTVFRSGAQIKRNANVNLKTGSNDIIIADLPSGFIESSIVIKADPGIEISSVSFRNNYTKNFESNPEYQTLKNQFDALIEKRENEIVVNETWKEEENLILSNKRISSENSGFSSDQLVKVADLFRIRLLDVKQKLLESSRKIVVLEKEKNKIEAQMKELGSKYGNQVTGEVQIVIISKANTNELLEISYIDPRAQWATSFDLRLESLQKPLNLVNKGKITQFTGEDWSNINLKLSTGNPQSNIQFPVINPWFLYYFENQMYYQNAKKSGGYPVQARMEDNVRVSTGIVNEEIVAKENITFMEYILPDKMSIPSDSKEHEVKLKNNEISAGYEYIAIPKTDNNVYLQAKILDWDQFNLSSGELKLYFEGTYIGTSYLNANILSDTLTLSLGPDIAIACKREKLKDLKKTSFFSGKRQIQSGYEITLKNNKPTSVDVVLNDQIPISTDSEMEIEAEELSGGKLNKETGIIEWKLKMKPGEQVKKRLAYTVKIPKDKKVSL
jgi:uncharacterized protein (TIGR02231 family)